MQARGWTLAWAHVRGGGECGRAWHEAAVRRAKAASVADLEACADWLAAAGLAAPGRVALRGASAGGLAAGAALVRRPRRYGAAVLQARGAGAACHGCRRRDGVRSALLWRGRAAGARGGRC